MRAKRSKIISLAGKRRERSLYSIALPAILVAAALGAVISPSLPLSGNNKPSTIVEPAAFVGTSNAHFSLCGSGKRVNCVVDGDTFWLGREKVRIADIDTPELSPPRCRQEKELGERAKSRLLSLLNAGSFKLDAADRDEDRYGRKLRIVTRGGQSLGNVLVSEGLARPWNSPRRDWCA